jgi:hypothetical protein
MRCAEAERAAESDKASRSVDKIFIVLVFMLCEDSANFQQNSKMVAKRRHIEIYFINLHFANAENKYNKIDYENCTTTQINPNRQRGCRKGLG